MMGLHIITAVTGQDAGWLLITGCKVNNSTFMLFANGATSAISDASPTIWQFNSVLERFITAEKSLTFLTKNLAAPTTFRFLKTQV
jgi:hypothetical protein